MFGPTSTQIEINKEVIQQSVNEVSAGYNCTVFTYGQRGSGKTFTDGNKSWETDCQSGIIHHCFNHLFEALHEFSVIVSFFKIYNEAPIELLSPPNDTTKKRL